MWQERDTGLGTACVTTGPGAEVVGLPEGVRLTVARVSGLHLRQRRRLPFQALDALLDPGHPRDRIGDDRAGDHRC